MLTARYPQKGTLREDTAFGGLREIAFTVCLALALAALPGISRADYVDSPVCQAHLSKIEGQLSNVSFTDEPSETTGCAALHSQVRVMLAARNFYKRCATGDERLEQIDLTEGSIAMVTSRISENCSSN